MFKRWAAAHAQYVFAAKEKNKMEVALSLFVVVGATGVVLNLSRFANKSPFSISSLEYINTQSKYQVLLLGVALLVLFVLYFVNAANFSAFLAPGNLAAPAKKFSWLGISEGESWLGLGLSLTFFVTLATSTFIYLKFRKSVGGLKKLLPFLPWVLLFSLSNAFSEEVIYRLGVVVWGLCMSVGAHAGTTSTLASNAVKNAPQPAKNALFIVTHRMCTNARFVPIGAVCTTALIACTVSSTAVDMLHSFL